MNIQTERLENHTARLTVEVEVAQWENAKRKAARQLSKRYRIPGFRPGKAPYNIVQKMVGEAAIIEDAMEDLGNDIYRDALRESDLRPYTSGSLEDFKLDPPTYIFTVPLEPEVDLNEYRSIRKDFVAPEIEEDAVDKALLELQQQEAEGEETEGPVALGQRITVDVHSEFVDGPLPPELEAAEAETEETEADEADEAEATEETADEADEAESDDSDADEADENIIYQGTEYLHEHAAVYVLDPENEPVLPGFNAAMEGATIGETVEFELDIPEDDSPISGRKVSFHATVSKIETVTVPELDDEFAAKLSADEETQLDLAGLRARVRKNLEDTALQSANEAYANQVLDDIVAQATISFADATVEERIEEMLKDLDQTLRRQGISLEDYMKITNTSKESLFEQYQPTAEENLRRSLVMGEFVMRENLRVTDAMLDAEIEDMLVQFGAQGEMFRSFLDTPQQRQNMANNLLYRQALDVLGQIGRGEEVTVPALAALKEADLDEEAAEDVAVVAEDPVADTADTDEQADSSAAETEEAVAEEEDTARGE